MKFLRLLFLCAIGISLLASDFAKAQTTVTIGTGTSSSSTRGPFQRSDTNSTTVYSRWVQIYTASELATAGLTAGVLISEVQWELASSNVIVGSGNAYLNIYVRNSSATAAVSDTWVNHIAGSTLAYSDSFNTTNNFPGANGWMPFTFSTPFTYTGGALEIAVDWDCSQVSTPAFDGDGAIKWRWASTAPDELVVKKTASSGPPSTVSDLKDERANIQIVYGAAPCSAPSNFVASNITTTSADLGWTASPNASTYNWKVVAGGAGSAGTAVDAGTTANTTATTTALAPFTSYDLFVEGDCGANGTSGFEGPYSFFTLPASTSMAIIGTGTSSSSTRGPFQRSDTNSTTVYSRFVHIYTASELATAGITVGSSIIELDWELASSNVIIGNGDAILKVYIKNSTATTATSDSWTNLITGSSLVVDHLYNTTNNFPGANGWMPFAFSTPFVYTGGSLEIAVDWDCSGVSTPAFDGDGAIKWRWESTAPDELVVKKTASSGPPSTISDVKDERANIQFVFSAATCDNPVSLRATNITTTSANFSWSDTSASSYNWKVVLQGAGSGGAAVDAGTTSTTTASSTMLAAATSYDFYVEADCGAIGTSGFTGPHSFRTLCSTTPTTTVAKAVVNVSCNGGNDGAIDLTVTAGNPSYSFSWSNADTTEDISGLSAGLYAVTITDGDGCPYFDSVLVVEPAAIAIAATSTPDTANAGLGSASVVVTGGTAPYSYVWDGAAGSADSTGLTAGTYQVVITDANGCTDSVSIVVDNTVSISQFDYVTKLSITPNPTNGIVTIDLALTQHAEVGIAIYTLRGELITELVQSNTNQLSQQLDLSAYPSGMYFVRFAINKQVSMKKLVLQK